MSVFTRKSAGFTLIEMVTVIVILSVVAAMGSSFVVSSIESYNQAQQRSKLVQRSRQALEQISRQLRDAVPNSVRVTNSNTCLEFLPVAASLHYLETVPDAANGAAPSDSISTAPFGGDFSTELNSVRFAAIAPLSAAELYGAGPGSLEAINATAAGSVTLSAAKQWLRNSSRRRVYLADAPTAFCLFAGNLRVFQGFDTSLPLTTVTPSAAGILMGRNAAAAGANPVFAVSNGTEDRNAVVTINLRFSEGGESVDFNHQVMVRNVP